MSAAPRHVLLISLHTCPLEQPGSGDAGGMNVYVRHLAEALVDAGHTVDMATLDRGRGAPAVNHLFGLGLPVRPRRPYGLTG